MTSATRKRPVSMTQKARELCRAKGWHYGQVDQRIPGTFIARDPSTWPRRRR